jgi:hypothetical protein
MGLNLEGICCYKQCLAFKKKVWIRKGFGTFSLQKETAISKCPVCGIIADKV